LHAVDQYLLLITTTCSTARRQQSDCLRSSLQASLHQPIAITVYYAAVAAAHLVLQAAEELELEPHLNLHVVDAWKLEPSFEVDLQLDFLWIDFGAGRKLAEFLQQWWHRVPAGGIIALHSTVTNSYTREWLDEMRAGAGQPLGPWGDYVTLSLLEPHKLFQNSTTLLQKRGTDWSEPVYTRYP
jgi:Methyltransferase domain